MDWEAFYARFREPDFIPGYEILNRLGGGAFGEVYKARKHSIGKSFAIKFLKVGDDSARAAIERELEQVRHFAAIDHPNLVTIEDLGSVMGVPYLVMGYAGERTLAQALRQGALSREAALDYFGQTCRGVAALHDLRLAHFDLKPGNVFLKGDEARVGDYGLSRLLGEGRMTLSFSRGTPQYMAPEMLMSRGDERADIYSLGVILYECLSGKLPFQSEIPGAIPLRDSDEPPVFPAEFPLDLKPIVARCLRLAPADRYATVHALIADLESIGAIARAGEPVPAVRTHHLAPTPLTPPALAGSTRIDNLLAGAVVAAGASIEPSTSSSGPTLREGPQTIFKALVRSGASTAVALWQGFRFQARPSELTSAPPVRAVGTIPLPPAARTRGLELPLSIVLLAFEILIGLVRGAYLTLRFDSQSASGSDEGLAARSYHLLVRSLSFLAVLFLLGAMIAFVVLMMARGDL